jgi:hypothetical protein
MQGYRPGLYLLRVNCSTVPSANFDKSAPFTGFSTEKCHLSQLKASHSSGLAPEMLSLAG